MRKSKRRRKRIGLRVFFLGAGALAILVLSLFWGFRWYHSWQAERFVRRAQTYLSWGDAKSATLSARQVLEFDPSNADALRVMADVSEQQGLSSAIDWRRKIVEHDPGSVGDAVALAKTALKFGAVQTAETSLDRIAKEAQTNAGYHQAVGQLALAKKNRTEAELHFQEALKLEPQDHVFQLELAAVQLRSDNGATRQSAREVLERLLQDNNLRVTAAKTLLQDAIEQKDPAIIQLAEALRTFPEAPFSDRLLCLQLFARLQLPQFAAALTDTQEEAAKSPEKLATLLSWMSTNNLSMVALDWTKRLPPDSLTKRPVFVAVADCYVATNDWPGLEHWCKTTKWENLDFLRHAYLARAGRGTDTINSELEWSKAIKEAVGADDLETLQKRAARWDWKKESIELLWSLTNSAPKQKAALSTLYQYYGEQGDTGNLYRVAARLSHVAPEDLEAQNNFAQLSLLLNVDPERARALARELYEGHKTDANFASTYAFALYTQRRVDQAAAVMTALPEEELKRPEIAAYYGIMLSAAGARDKAQQFLEIGKTARLLPEEKKLVEDAVAH